MAFIKYAHVEDLATRRINLEIELNRDVNVFFGVNGSGKTSLLRILQGSLTGRGSELKTVPFGSASIGIAEAYVLNPPEVEDYFGDLNRRTLSEMPPAGQAFLNSEMLEAAKSERGGRKVWYCAEQGISDQAFQLRHLFLPISRLYVNDDRRLPRALRDSTRESLLSEAAIEKIFADVINFLWLRYTRNTSLEIQEMQSVALSEILEDFLSPDPDVDEPYEMNIEEAHRRLQAFLERQQRFVAISQEAFASRIKREPRMRRVLKYIEAVENHVEEIKRPRNEFDRILKAMISSEKTVALGDRDIHAYSESEEISLGNLSSGEKQLLRICIEALLADGEPVLIDEPELSMHIDWQRQLIPAIRSLAPKSQLIIATHSPEIMAPLHNHQIFEL